MARYTYTPGGRLATIESGNGIITRYTYDGEGNLSIPSFTIRGS